MTVEHTRVGVVEDRRLHPAAEERLRFTHEVLVERVLARDQDRQPVAAASGAAPLLAEARDRAREPRRDHAVEQADVDAELERVGRRHAEQLAGGQPLLDAPSLRWRIPRPVRGEPVAVLGAEPVRGELVDQLGRLPALREAERAQPALDQGGHQAGFQSAIVRSARGAASSPTTVTSRPSSECASWPGFAIVAEASRNCGSAP